MTNHENSIVRESRFMAALLGGAIGDALGYTVEFMSMTEIYAQFGASGITDLQIDRRKEQALISDDTQMTLFTADGLLWATAKNPTVTTARDIHFVAEGIYPSYLRWYHTQQGTMPLESHQTFMERQAHESNFSILDDQDLFARRAPGNTCITALASGTAGSMETPKNHSKGCGGVMRVSPVGLFLHTDPSLAFRVAAEAAAVTHGHASGYLAAGAFAAVVAELVNEKEISEGVDTALCLLRDYRHHEETSKAIEKAVNYACSSERPEKAIVELGEGWVAEEALSIGLYCAMKRRNYKASVMMAVNHGGDSDSTGSIAGTLLGAYGGMDIIPEEWLRNMEMVETIKQVAQRLHDASNKFQLKEA